MMNENKTSAARPQQVCAYKNGASIILPLRDARVISDHALKTYPCPMATRKQSKTNANPNHGVYSHFSYTWPVGGMVYTQLSAPPRAATEPDYWRGIFWRCIGFPTVYIIGPSSGLGFRKREKTLM